MFKKKKARAPPPHTPKKKKLHPTGIIGHSLKCILLNLIQKIYFLLKDEPNIEK